MIAAAILAAIPEPDETPVIATLSWDRLLVDPLPGPRSAADFEGLTVHAPGSLEVTEATRPIPPAGSLLPRLAKELPARLFLLDPTEGAVGLGNQLRAIASTTDAKDVVLVDVGGDLVADGSELGLRSPLADALVLAGCLNAGLPVTISVCGPGLDGELTERQVFARCRSLDGSDPAALTPAHVEPFRALFQWHPSEATGLLVAAAMGRRGLVEIRDAGSRVPLTASSPVVIAIPNYSVATANPYSGRLTGTRTLVDTNAMMRQMWRQTELDYEGQKAAKRKLNVHDLPSEVQINILTEQARSRGLDFVTIRRLAELLGLVVVDTGALVATLAEQDDRRIDPPLWEVRTIAG